MPESCAGCRYWFLMTGCARYRLHQLQVNGRSIQPMRWRPGALKR